MRERDIFMEALLKEGPAEREAYLATACMADAELRQRVDGLLLEHQRPGRFLLDAPPVGMNRTVDAADVAKPDTTVGLYKLLQQIGEGGMGVVYLAEQTEPVERRVALKIIKPGMDSRHVISRFRAEWQALALMDHPNIAKVLDAGTTEGGARSLAQGMQHVSRPAWHAENTAAKDPVSSSSSSCPEAKLALDDEPSAAELAPAGRPFFVMELVDGLPMTRFCDDNRLTLRQRLELFVSVCHAIQHAHQKGIIHRDIKPSNVLVTRYDGQPVPKVIDFGVAKATEQTLSERTLFTQFGTLVGTLEYMAPEQAEVSALGADTRSDIYSLGVLLYELLTGSTPISHSRIQGAAYDEVVRMIREDEPPSPSIRLSSLGAGLTAISTQRRTDPARLTKLVRGELDWIVMKCLEKDRNRRYDSASSLATDVQRYLNDEPVQACPPSAWYRLGKFARRNKAASAVGLALLLALAVSATSTVLIARQQRVTAGALQAETSAKEALQRDSYFHRIALAHRELSVDNLRRALELLALCPVDLRNWEWRYLMRLCRVEPVILKNESEVNALSFSPDGELIAAACGDGKLRIWSCRSQRLIQEIDGGRGFFSSVAFHPHGRHVATVGSDMRVKVWELSSEAVVFEAPCGASHMFGTANAVAFSPGDGRRLAAGSDGTVNIWDWSGNRPLHALGEVAMGPVNLAYRSRINVAFSHDGERLALGSWRGSVKLWEIDDEARLLGDFSNTRHPISGLAFSRDGRLATSGFERRVEVWDTATGKLLHHLKHDGLVQGVAFSPDGQRLASVGEDKTVRIWDADSGREVLGLRGHTGMCGNVAFSPDGHYLASASLDGTIRLWDATPQEEFEGQEGLTFRQHDNEIWSLAIHPEGGQVVSAGFSTPAKVWDMSTGKVSTEFADHAMITFCVAWHPDGERIVSAGMDHERFAIKVWDACSGQEHYDIPAGHEFFTAAFTTDGRYLVSGGADRKVQVWDGTTGELVQTLGTHRGIVRGVAISPCGRHLASASADGQLKLWDATRLNEEQPPRYTLPVRVHGPCLNIAFSPNGARLASGGLDNTVQIWDVQRGELLWKLVGHKGDVYSLAFSRDGRFIATASEDSTVKVWDGQSAALVRTLRGHRGLVSSVAFSPDGQQLVSGSRDRTVKIWNASLWDAMAKH